VNSTLYPAPGTNDPLLIYQNGSPCPLRPEDHATTVIRVSPPLKSEEELMMYSLYARQLISMLVNRYS
jgi:hypothetical protein